MVVFLTSAIALGIVFLYGCVEKSSPKRRDTSIWAFPAS